MTTLVDNSKVHFDYEIIESLDAGIELRGLEVKALKEKNGSLVGSYVIIKGGEVFLVGMLIPPYQEKNTPKDYNPRRNRRLILTKQEILRLTSIETGKSALTIVP
ncbi:MAG: hypothetical protein RL536_130, partial [Candidatus Parcubacteria bacterium]